MKNTGQLIKKIRLNKYYSQSYLAKDYLTQSAYSYFEKENRLINHVAFIDILDKLDLSLEEFLFIQNDYKYTGKEAIIKKFFQLNYNEISQIKEIIKECELFLEENYNQTIYQYKEISRALLTLKTTGSIDLAREIIKPIWDDLSKLNQFYLRDIMMINVILFVFDEETAIEIVNTLEKRLLEYGVFSVSKELIVAIYYNLFNILLQNGSYELVYSKITNNLKDYKDNMNYSRLLIYLNKKAICEYKLGKNEELNETITTMKFISNIFGDSSFTEDLEREFVHYKKL